MAQDAPETVQNHMERGLEPQRDFDISHSMNHSNWMTMVTESTYGNAYNIGIAVRTTVETILSCTSTCSPP